MIPAFLKQINNTWTLFLDRDGVINKQIIGGYVSTPEECEFLPGVLDSLVFFSSIFKRIIVITNQQGVGIGIMTEADLTIVHNHMIEVINKVGSNLDAIYYCTDRAETLDNCRKPSPFMAQKAIFDFPDIDLAKSIMVGDSLCDIEFGNNTGMKTLFTGSDYVDNQAASMADFKVKSLFELKTIIEKL